ncbi:hypothetical protein MIND_00222500 [Mycena indigotica]|uniref:Uncharacterized protein n=1 Tax=Mycena indigotica TaxID=2126181 RepID=A0A8H6T8V9_9AGAR|nr:uncharacterized protein MIND_00222500 [Mycena indigotica]KAF7312102.1 hypothetical protein MIND_00222500 [Mycena indigotica]
MMDIELTHIDIMWQPEPIRFTLLGLLCTPTTKRLLLQDCCLPTWSSYVLVPGLTTLELVNPCIETDYIFSLPPSQARPRHVIVEGNDIGDVVDWLVASGELLQEVSSICIRHFTSDYDSGDRLVHATTLKNPKVIEVGLLCSD